MGNLKSLSEIFEHRLIRIPDYQRGYAWSHHELDDFWEDLLQLAENRIHYTGVITFEPVKAEAFKAWPDDAWLIEGKGYKPYYVVDGQQRLTTSIILVQAITENVADHTELNYQTKNEIHQKYVQQVASDGLRQSFLFGYEKDDPSEQYLRTRIFGQGSSNSQYQDTLYTQNLAYAKNFFLVKLKEMNPEEVACIFRKLTQKLKFNVYEIDDEIDVFVTFETMNNRGRPLSNLELLKNRLIYLSTLFHDNAGHPVLRQSINETWKTIYEHLGKNPDRPLSDNSFLRNHWIMYFQYTRNKGDDYIRFLLDEKFTARGVTHPATEDKRVTIEEIVNYVRSLQEAIKPWFHIHNPHFPLPGFDNSKTKDLLDALNRLSFRAFRPLILAAFCTNQLPNDINRLLSAAERYNFTIFTISQRRANTGDSEFYGLARRLLRKELTIEFVVSMISSWTEKYYSATNFERYIKERYELGRQGFYHWDGIHYLLYEYETHLLKRGKQATRKLDWHELTHSKKDHVTIEHIYPQTETDYWAAKFNPYTNEQKRFLSHSLGNLLPLSRAKNASLQNDSFVLKKNNGNGVGYYNGSCAENEVGQLEGWNPEEVLSRGLRLLKFIEERWSITLGDENVKRQLLCLDFVKDDNQQI